MPDTCWCCRLRQPVAHRPDEPPAALVAGDPLPQPGVPLVPVQRHHLLRGGPARAGRDGGDVQHPRGAGHHHAETLQEVYVSGRHARGIRAAEGDHPL